MAAATAQAPRSPATSPRLPSPPPFPEVQLPPKSPGMPAADSPASPPSSQSLRRIRPGTKAADMASGPLVVPLNELDSAFQLQEHLKSLHSSYTHPASSSTTSPITHSSALEIAQPPPSVDRSLWLYELTRFCVMRANDLLVSFFRESPPCSSQTCPEMRASEWQYLCAVHEPPKPCCAIDYSCHTLDWAAYTLTSQKVFPSRLTLDGAGGGGGVRQLTNIMRRVYRIFAHAWFSHRQTFWEVETREGLYVLFKTICDVYGLIPEDNYTIPKEAEGESVEGRERQSPEKKGQGSPEKKAKAEEGDEVKAQQGTQTALRRHKTTPSVGSAVATIQEGDEDEKEGNAGVGGLLDKLAKSTIGEAPLAAISNEAENVELPSVKREEGDRGSKAESNAAGEANDSSQDSVVSKDEDNSAEASTGLQRSTSSDSVATMVKVEEKASDDE